MTKEKFNILHQLKENFHIPPFPKNMHPVHHDHTTQERAKSLQKKFLSCNDVVYVDASRVFLWEEICVNSY